MKKLYKLTDKLHTPTWLFVLLIVVFILRIPSLFEPYSYGDETIYLALGEAIRQGIPLYSGLHDNKPPMLYMVAAIAGNLFWFKAILTFWMLLTIYFFWKLTETLFPKNIKSQVIGTIIFALLTTIPLIEGNIVNAEMFMVGPTILAFWILLSKKLTPKNLLFSGVLFSISTLFKVPAFFDIPAIIFLWLTGIKKPKLKSLRVIVNNTSYILIGFLTPIIFTLIWYFFQGALKEYVTAAFLQNVGYLSSWRSGGVQEHFLAGNLPLMIRSLIVAGGFLLLYWKRTQLSRNFIFATGWLLLSLFSATLSERPYPHYLVQGIAPFSILMTIFFTQKSFEQVLVLIPLSLALFVPHYYKFWYYPTLPYYEKFVKLISGKYSREQYFATFGPNVIRNYKISEFITPSLERGNKIFVWGKGSSYIYAMTKSFPPGKYVADYHIKDFSNDKETISVLKEDLPSFIIFLPSSSEITGMQKFLNTNYGYVEDIEGAEIWKLLKPEVRSILSF